MSDTDGSEDVFLDLAQSDEEPDQLDHTLRALPGQYPAVLPRPKSSGVLSPPSDRTATAWASLHTRHASQPITTRGRDASETPRLRRQGHLYPDADEYSDAHSMISASARPRPATILPSDPFPRDSDSADSVTAASTVWDELDDLKSRIRNLETSRVPGRTAGRPQTATTAPTALSSSPQNARKRNELAQDLHPTLQSALARAKTTLQPHIYRPLEATAMDALGLASSPTSASPSTINGSLDRQLRRKADSMCRNLTDLCIAICDTRKEEASPVHANAPSPRYYSPKYSESREDSSFGRQSRRDSIGLGRLDNYRAARGISINGDAQPMSPSVVAKDYASRYSSIGAVQEQRGRQPYSAEPETAEDRPPSRAMTDLQSIQGRSSKVDHLRSAATAHRSPSLRETLEARRRSGTFRFDVDTQSAVGVSSQTPAARRFYDRVRGPASEVGGSTPSVSRYLTTPRVTSLGQGRFGPAG